MANAGQTKAVLDGLMKDVYGENKLESMVPDFGILYKKIKFSEAKKIGRDFAKAISLSREAGFTYGAGLQTLSGIISQGVDDAKVRGVPMTLQAGWSYDAAAAMASDKGAFINSTAHKFQCMMEAAVFRLELQMLYGNIGIAVTDASTGTASPATGDYLTAVTNTQDVVIAIDPLYWAAGIFAGCEGAWISLYRNSDNSTGSAADGGDSSNTENKFEIISVDTSAKSITVRTKDATEAAALVVELEANAYNVYFHGAKANEMVGLKSIVSNTGSLYGISAASYSTWRGNTYAVGSANLTLKKAFLAVSQAVGRGLLEDATLVVNPLTFATMANDEAALRQYTGKVVTADRGVENIEFVGPNGKIEVIAHPLMQESLAIAFPTKKAERIGASDLTFKRPGGSDEMIQEMATQTGFECRLYSDQSIFLPDPSKSVLITGISNA
jgi:hypothetical protein